jgi:hypothetical protein
MSITNIHMGLSGMGWSRIAIGMCTRRYGIGMRIFRMCIIGMGIGSRNETPDATKPALGGLCRRELVGRGNLNHSYKTLIFMVFYFLKNSMEYILEYVRVVCRFE